MYCSGFPDAQELRIKLMETETQRRLSALYKKQVLLLNRDFDS